MGFGVQSGGGVMEPIPCRLVMCCACLKAIVSYVSFPGVKRWRLNLVSVTLSRLGAAVLSVLIYSVSVFHDLDIFECRGAFGRVPLDLSLSAVSQDHTEVCSRGDSL